MKNNFSRILFLFTVLCGANSLDSVVAHEVRPAYLELREIEPGICKVTWKVPRLQGASPDIWPVFPENWSESPRSEQVMSDAKVERWSVRTGASGLNGVSGLNGARIEIKGLEATRIDVLLRIEHADGRSHTVMLRADDREFTVPKQKGTGQVAWTYLLFGVEHILLGIDHLLFVLALLMITTGTWRLVKTITAFTIAHSITLTAAVLGIVQVPSAPVEAIIALSILFLASELVHGYRGRTGLAEKQPWLVSFTFGLLHGFGFAGALREVGLPEHAIPVALFQFNLGVEIGQLLFVAAVLAVIAVVKRYKADWPHWARLGPAYAIGSVAAFWCIQRIGSFWL